MTSGKKGSIGSAIVWIFIISVLLFWLPVIGPLIAGIVGGKKAGGVGSAIIAVFLPGIFFAIILFLLAPKQARMGRESTADAGSQKTGRTCCELVSPPPTEGVLLLPIFGSPY
jgi:hypothetical protein